MSRARRAVTIPWAHARELRHCAALRVFQVTGVIPALLANARFGVPARTTHRLRWGGGSPPRGRPRAPAVGLFPPEKTLSALVQAAARLRDRVPLTLVLVGAGPLEAALREEARAGGGHGGVPGGRGPARRPA